MSIVPSTLGGSSTRLRGGLCAIDVFRPIRFRPRVSDRWTTHQLKMNRRTIEKIFVQNLTRK